MPKHERGCPSHHELDLYSGCSLGCLYCVGRARHSPGVEPAGDLDALCAEIAAASRWPRPTYLSPWTDAYQPAEHGAQRTGRVVRALAARDFPFFVITKSALVLRDVEFFLGRENAFVAISLNSLDDRLSQRLEPGAPSASERLALIAELCATRGLRTVVKIDPILPALGDDLEALTARLCELRPYAVTAETLRLSRGIAAALAPALSPDEQRSLLHPYQPLTDEPEHPSLDYRLQHFDRLATDLEGAGVRAAFCRATLPRAVTPHDCRGGYAA